MVHAALGGGSHLPYGAQLSRVSHLVQLWVAGLVYGAQIWRVSHLVQLRVAGLVYVRPSGGLDLKSQMKQYSNHIYQCFKTFIK